MISLNAESHQIPKPEPPRDDPHQDSEPEPPQDESHQIHEQRLKKKEESTSAEKEVALCVVCFEDWSDLDQQTKQLYTCPCLVRICNECFLGWAKSQIESQLQREKVEWKCPRPADSRSEPQPQERQVRQACQVFPLDALVEMIQNFRDKNGAKMDPDFEQSIVECQNVLCDAALKHYLIRSEDIRACPDSKCTSYGIILIDPLTGFVECTKPLQCIACGVTWRDPLQRDTAATSVAYCLK